MTGVYLKENRDEIPEFKLFKNYVKSVLCQNQSLTFSVEVKILKKCDLSV